MMNATKFVFPAFVSIGEAKHLTIEFTPEIEDTMDKIYEHIDELKVNSLTPKYVVLGKNQYKEVTAFVSYGLQKGLIPKDFDGIPIVVLDQDNYLDVLPDVQDMFTKMVKDDGELV